MHIHTEPATADDPKGISIGESDEGTFGLYFCDGVTAVMIEMCHHQPLSKVLTFLAERAAEYEHAPPAGGQSAPLPLFPPDIPGAEPKPRLENVQSFPDGFVATIVSDREIKTPEDSLRV